MRLRHRLGIGIINMTMLALILIYIFFGATPVHEWGIITVSGLWLFIIVVVLWIGVNAIASGLLTTMRQDSTLAKLGKSIVGGIIVIALFDWILFPVLFVFGYAVTVDVRQALIIGSLIRTVVGIWLKRRWGGEVV